MKNKKIVIAACSVLVLIIIGVIKFRSHDTGVAIPSVWVQTAQVTSTSLPLEIQAIGTLVARSVDITPEVAGHVEKVFFQDGAFVKQGTPLIQLDDAVYRAKNASAKAQLAYSENNYKRMTVLGKQGAIARQAIDLAEADVKEKRATAEESTVMVNKMQLKAPFDGMVSKSQVNPGHYVTVGQGLVTLTDVKHLHIEYAVPEAYLGAVKLGQAVTITTTAYPGKTFTGKLAYISPSINTENRSLSLYAEIPNDNNVLAAGMFVQVTHLLGTQKNVLVVPARSLVPSLEGEQVYKVEQGKALAVKVMIGKRTDKTVQIIEGLAANDVVITDGQLKVKSGMPVKVKADS